MREQQNAQVQGFPGRTRWKPSSCDEQRPKNWGPIHKKIIDSQHPAGKESECPRQKLWLLKLSELFGGISSQQATKVCLCVFRLGYVSGQNSKQSSPLKRKRSSKNSINLQNANEKNSNGNNSGYSGSTGLTYSVNNSIGYQSQSQNQLYQSGHGYMSGRSSLASGSYSIHNAQKRTPSPQPTKIEKYTFNKGLFTYHHVIGKGGFGKVWKVELKRNGKTYAMK